MKRLRELSLLVSKKGPSGEFHHVLLMNPNVALELMRINNQVQTNLYARFMDRLTEVGGLREIESAHAFWQRAREQQAAEEAKKAAAAAAAVPSPPLSEATVVEAALEMKTSVAAVMKSRTRKLPVERSASEAASKVGEPARVRRVRRGTGA